MKMCWTGRVVSRTLMPKLQILKKYIKSSGIDSVFWNVESFFAQIMYENLKISHIVCYAAKFTLK